jgi:desulfoferrodoxin (superoxide reductase-like protein)
MGKKSFLLALFILIVFASTAFADKTSISIESPQSVKKGTEITIKIAVSHNGNNFFHYTNWVYVRANGKEIARWDFSSGNRPESNNFIREIKYTVTEKTEIAAMGNCNIHGSEGEVNMLINIE